MGEAVEDDCSGGMRGLSKEVIDIRTAALATAVASRMARRSRGAPRCLVRCRGSAGAESRPVVDITAPPRGHGEVDVLF